MIRDGCYWSDDATRNWMSENGSPQTGRMGSIASTRSTNKGGTTVHVVPGIIIRWGNPRQ